MTVIDDTRTTALANARSRFRTDLIEAGLLFPMGIDGLYGRGAQYERVFDGVQHAIREKGRALHGNDPTVLRFPPVFPRVVYEKTDYIASFPDLTGAVFTFHGGDREHRALLSDRDAGRDWNGHLDASDKMLVSAACHPTYAIAQRMSPAGGQRFDVSGYCFRHEPAIDPMRMQAFRMREFVLIGTPEQARAHRESWTDGALDMFHEMGLTAAPTAANDPFFGRVGSMLANNQLADDLKTELVVRIYGDLDDGTAITSTNLHQDHFTEPFDLVTADGFRAHSACVGIGVDRITLALFKTHGLEPDSWSDSVLFTLGLTEWN